MCRNQAFRFKNRLFGFQYHFEFTAADIEKVVVAGREDVTKVRGPSADVRIMEETTRHYPRYARLGDRILQNFVQFLKVY